MTDVAEDPPLECVAFHEAGHAVIAYAQGRRRKHVTIAPGEGALGHCARYLPPWNFRPDIEIGIKARLAIEADTVSLLAGAEADRRHCGSAPRGAEWDYSAAYRLADCVSLGDRVETSAFVEWLRLRAVRLLRQHHWWIGVQAVAGQLLERRQLTGREVATTVQNAIQEWSDRERAQRGLPSLDQVFSEATAASES